MAETFSTQFDKRKAAADLERGDLLRLLAEVEAGEITPQDLEAAARLRSKKFRFRVLELLRTFFQP
jgi:hypothetical protein